MFLSDISYVIQWWQILFTIGIAFFPISLLLFPSFVDKGYIFAKVIGIVCISYAIYTLGTFKIVPFTPSNTYALSFLVFLFSLLPYFFIKHKNIIEKKSLFFLFLVIFIEEVIFLAGLFFWSYVRGHQPNIHGLEKFMDLGIVNSILHSYYFPAKDTWLTPFSINYYYYGHLITAVLTVLSKIPSNISYNLMIATLFSFTLSGGFSLGINLFYGFLNPSTKENLLKKSIRNIQLGLSGVVTAFLLALGGNLHTIYIFFKPYQNENPVPFWKLPFLYEEIPNSYWYPNATRFIYNTIHEFPIYSFVVSDLHGHVIGIPIVLTIIAIVIHSVIYTEKLSVVRILILSFLVACAYMTNALDGVVYILLCGLTIVILHTQKKLSFKISFRFLLNLIPPLAVFLIGFFIFTIPFSIHFNSFVSGVGVLCAPDFLTKIGKIGPLLFEADHCQKSPFWQLFILHGFFYTWILIFCISIFRTRKIVRTDIAVLLLILVSTILIVIPEFIYFKDIYPNHYRANTMFKFVYQAFIMLSLCAGYSMFRVMYSMRLYLVPLVGIGVYMLCLVSIYPYFAINSYYNNLSAYKGLDGTAYLASQYPDDFSAIQWIEKNIKDQVVILEAQGDSYTDFARVSVHTGMPTVLGWTVHEWLWRGSYNIPSPRIADVQALYESQDINLTKKLIKQYNISYVFVGDLERQKYPNIQIDKFTQFGYPVFSKNNTVLYKLY